MMELEGLSMSDVDRTNMSPLRRGCKSIFDTEDKMRNLFILVEEANGLICDSDQEPTTCVSVESCSSQVCFEFLVQLISYPFCLFRPCLAQFLRRAWFPRLLLSQFNRSSFLLIPIHLCGSCSIWCLSLDISLLHPCISLPCHSIQFLLWYYYRRWEANARRPPVCRSGTRSSRSPFPSSPPP